MTMAYNAYGQIKTVTNKENATVTQITISAENLTPEQQAALNQLQREGMIYMVAQSATLEYEEEVDIETEEPKIRYYKK